VGAAFVGALALGLVAACDGASLLGSSRSNVALASDAGAGAGDVDASAATIDDATALGWLDAQCKGCHGPKPATGVQDPAWAMPEVLTREWLEVSESTPLVYDLLRRKREGTGAGEYPSPMPAAVMTSDDMTALASVVRWFETNLPDRVWENETRVGRVPLSTQRPAQPRAFACTHPSSARTFLGRIMSSVLGRGPTDAELASFGQGLDAPIDAAARASLAAAVEPGGVWHDAFLDAGLRSFAHTVATVGATPYPGWVMAVGTNDLPPEVMTDLGDELYQLMRAHYGDWDYREYFTADVVMASANTAPLYGCAAPATATWAECPLAEPRGGFFTTFSYLSSLRQSMFGVPNSTRRLSGLYFTLYGEGPPRVGVVGEPAPPVPDCMDPNDTRELPSPNGSGPQSRFGTAAVLGVGKVCQSCHLQNGVAAGSIVFRPFATDGRVLTPGSITDGSIVNPDDSAALPAVLAGGWLYRPNGDPEADLVPVTAPFIQSLLPPDNIRACIATGNPDNPYDVVQSVNDVVRHFQANRPALARGFLRHAQRSFLPLSDGLPVTSNQGPVPTKVPKAISAEQADRALGVFATDSATLPDLFAAYFSSDAFACDD
jgi:hypothetical protein